MLIAPDTSTSVAKHLLARVLVSFICCFFLARTAALADTQESAWTEFYDTGFRALHSLNLARAQTMLEVALDKAQESGNAKQIALTLNSLGETYLSQRNLPRAEMVLRQCIDISSNPATYNKNLWALSAADLGLLYCREGNYALSEIYYKEALELRKELLGTYHPHLATSMENLASVYALDRKYDLALNFYRQAWRIDVRTLPPEHPNTLGLMSNVAWFLWRQGKYQEAERVCYHLLDRTAKSSGTTSLAFASVLNKLASIYPAEGKYAHSLALYGWILDIARQTPIGQEHVALTYFHAAGIYNHMGRIRSAEYCYRKAIQIGQRTQLAQTNQFWTAYCNFLKRTNRETEAQEIAARLTHPNAIAARADQPQMVH